MKFKVKAAITFNCKTEVFWYFFTRFQPIHANGTTSYPTRNPVDDRYHHLSRRYSQSYIRGYRDTCLVDEPNCTDRPGSDHTIPKMNMHSQALQIPEFHSGIFWANLILVDICNNMLMDNTLKNEIVKSYSKYIIKGFWSLKAMEFSFHPFLDEKCSFIWSDNNDGFEEGVKIIWIKICSAWYELMRKFNNKIHNMTMIRRIGQAILTFIHHWKS